MISLPTTREPTHRTVLTVDVCEGAIEPLVCRLEHRICADDLDHEISVPAESSAYSRRRPQPTTSSPMHEEGLEPHGDRLTLPWVSRLCNGSRGLRRLRRRLRPV
jgi:hypothetical protein